MYAHEIIIAFLALPRAPRGSGRGSSSSSEKSKASLFERYLYRGDLADTSPPECSDEVFSIARAQLRTSTRRMTT